MEERYREMQYVAGGTVSRGLWAAPRRREGQTNGFSLENFQTGGAQPANPLILAHFCCLSHSVHGGFCSISRKAYCYYHNDYYFYNINL